ncbi:MAG: hypothetical protein PVJ86_05345, partial [Phycisphaerales bacterium]
LEVKTLGAFRDGEKPTLAIQILNSGIRDCEVLPEELAPTLLAKQPPELRPLSPSDGPSIALLTRSSIRNMSGYGRRKGGGVTQGVPYSWSIAGDDAALRRFALRPGEKKQILVTFDLPAGGYEFFAGYGGAQYGRKCIMSNSTCFDVGCEGKGKIVKDAHKTEVRGQQTSEVVNGLQLALAFRPRHDGWDELAISSKNAGSETFDIGSMVLVFLEARVGPGCWQSFQHSGWYLGGREQLLTLGPGQVESRVVTLREFFAFTPGKYLIRVSLVVDHDTARKYDSKRVWTGVIRSNHVEITVHPEEAKASGKSESQHPL